jgi:hypothetical protein
MIAPAAGITVMGAYRAIRQRKYKLAALRVAVFVLAAGAVVISRPYWHS